MSYLKPLIYSFLLIAFISILSIPLTIGDSTVPPIGSFFNPFSGFWQNAEAAEEGSEDLTLKGLKFPVTIHYDDRHVPHIYAKNLEDLVFAQGYIIAKERLWQMDITTRAIEGRVAEVLGKSSLEQDKRARERGLARAARLADETWKEHPRGYELIQRFSDGINQYISSLSPSDFPLEFKLLNYEPEPWSPYRTALFIKAMAITLNSRHLDVPTTNALTTFGRDTFYDLYPDRNKKQSPIIQEMEYPEASLSLQEKISHELLRLFDLKEEVSKEQFVGSNNFAVSGKKTQSGNAILANDPHLKLTLPSIWIEMHLVSPEMNAYGVSLPAMPGITLGFNESISWGQTNVGHDVFDIYEIDWVDETKLEYWLDGEKKKTEVVVEEIAVKGEQTYLDTVLYTYWGPVQKKENIHTDLAQYWVSAQKPSPREVEFYLDVNRAANFEAFQEALKNFYTPAQNFIFSSKQGDIAMVVTGKFPIKKDQQGRFVQDGSTIENEWQGYVPFDHLPMELNPGRGYVASANQHSTGDDYPYYYNGGFEDFRGRYINDQLDQMTGLTSQDLMNLQLDAYSLKAEEALPLLLEELNLKVLSPEEKQVVESLQGWNYVYTSNSKAATSFDLWWEEFYNMTFDEISANKVESDLPYVEDFRLIEMMEERHWIFDIDSTEEKESLTDIVQMSFEKVGFDEKTIEPWFAYRNTSIDHPTNINAFGYQGLSSPGHRNTPNAISKHNGPSWRMVVEMSDPIKAYGIYPGGVSGHPGSPFYDNFVEDWDEGAYYELNYSSDPAKIASAFSLNLNPSK